jgi:hypothetical protein
MDALSVRIELMAATEIESRVAVLEAEVARLKERLDKGSPAQEDWLEEICGAFANDPHFEAAMRLGREYRESLRPKANRSSARRIPKKPARKSLKGRPR